MKPDKKKILNRIYQIYDSWISHEPLSCMRGCAACCTQGVTMTALEGEVILEDIYNRNLQSWFAERLQDRDYTRAISPGVSTNSFAQNCFAGLETIIPEQDDQKNTCVFLLPDNTCKIYQVRPFGCRCFISLSDCRITGEALQPESIIAINTVTLQIIEHLGQKEFWGNMYDVLLSLCELDENSDIFTLFTEPQIILQAKIRLSKAQPVPGFLIMPEEHNRVTEFMEKLFKERIDNKSIEEILNNN